MTATNVRVFAAKLQQKDADGVFRDISNFLPRHLVWTQSHEPVVGGIAPDMGQHCDLGEVYHPDINPHEREAVGLSPSETCFEISTGPAFRFGPGIYRLHLRAAAENSKRIDRVIGMVLSGEWCDNEEEMLTKGIELKMV
jgi:hypothetical protein